MELVIGPCGEGHGQMLEKKNRKKTKFTGLERKVKKLFIKLAKPEGRD